MHRWTRRDVLSDLEQVIPLMPGAQLIGRDGDDFLGKIKVKVGPVTSEFNGRARFVEHDREHHRAVIEGKGKEQRGTGNAAATVAAQLHDAGDRTRVTVDTDLKIVGKLAQVGGGMLQQVSEKLLGQFVQSLEASWPRIPPRRATRLQSLSIRRRFMAEPAPIDLLQLAGGGMLKKYAPAGVAAMAVLLVIFIVNALRRRR